MKIDNYVIIARLMSEPSCKLINRIPDSHLLISSLPGLASRMHVESLRKHCNSRSILKRPCLVTLISKDNHLVFYISCF